MILDGKALARSLCKEMETSMSRLPGRKPHLAFLLVGDHPASQTYVNAKKKACAATGMDSTLITLPKHALQNELLENIAALNANPLIDGILVQLPLPSQIDEKVVMIAIDPKKDVDGFHPLNVGKMLLGDDSGYLPCTPQGIQALLHRNQIPVEGKRVVIVGRSNIVGKPLAAILMQKKNHCNATVTIAHSQSEHLIEITRSADILVACLGRPHFIKKEMVRPKATIIDVGINRLEEGKLVGDVDFEEVSKIASHITPVPGGVGPMTIAMLLQNTLLSYKRSTC
ncbi:MAG TPA: bifunctional methylenetetrahydrofolate dehydrogenase/methenyltetrahydrofolate cyclohydrolase FolD [Chlamydiales bacterium]|nr:bifunctional methylenetetrahydrofolate dehydrogenase/methenyltetrahydrofolate cyclohydrolase FolD [Chlamydiales bacterium]